MSAGDPLTARATSGEPEVIAAVDLGSNSFHMVVAQHSHGELRILDRLREMVRLSAGLDKSGRIQPEVADRAIACLERFGHRLGDMHASRVRAVGTNTLRRAHRQRDFLERAERALGHNIDIISGIEEARLVYLGAASSLPAFEGRRLVLDIGGGSTELVVGEGFEAVHEESLHMGCVSYSERFFPGGKITAGRFRRAKLAAKLELRPVKTAFRGMDWGEEIGASGTIRATQEVLRANGFSESSITLDGLKKLVQAMIDAGDVEGLDLAGLSPDRAPVYAGGVAILLEVFKTLRLEQMRVADGALREGVLYDTLGRLEDHEGARQRSVRAMEEKFHVDRDQADRVECTALKLKGQVERAWNLEGVLSGLTLAWAARLHECGLDIAHSGYHKHGAYLIEHADLPGFTWEEQRLLAHLVGHHRRKLAHLDLAGIPRDWREKTFRLIVLLRLAVLLHRNRGPADLPVPGLTAQKRSLVLKFPEGWLERQPLTQADLEQEKAYLTAAGFSLSIG